MKKTMYFSRIFLFTFLILCFFSKQSFGLVSEKKDRNEIRIGILAKRGRKICLFRWQATADYLNKKIKGYHFKIIPLAFTEVFHAAKNNTVHFFLTNPAYYVAMEQDYQAQRLATLRTTNDKNGKNKNQFGGVIFTRRDNKNINTLKDIKHKKFMAVHPNSFGGWHVAKRVLLKNQIIPKRDFTHMSFGKTHDAVVNAVLNTDVTQTAIFCLLFCRPLAKPAYIFSSVGQSGSSYFSFSLPPI